MDAQQTTPTFLATGRALCEHQKLPVARTGRGSEHTNALSPNALTPASSAPIHLHRRPSAVPTATVPEVLSASTSRALSLARHAPPKTPASVTRDSDPFHSVHQRRAAGCRRHVGADFPVSGANLAVPPDDQPSALQQRPRAGARRDEHSGRQ